MPEQAAALPTRAGGVAGWGSRAPVPSLPSGPPLSLNPRRKRDYMRTSLTPQRAGQETPTILLRQTSIQPASRLNSSLSATLAGRVNFAALLLCLVFVVVSHSHAPSAAVQLVLGSCVMRVPTRSRSPILQRTSASCGPLTTPDSASLHAATSFHLLAAVPCSSKFRP